MSAALATPTGSLLLGSRGSVHCLLALCERSFEEAVTGLSLGHTAPDNEASADVAPRGDVRDYGGAGARACALVDGER